MIPLKAKPRNEQRTNDSGYNKQPPYRVELKSANGGKVVVNNAIANKPKYQHVLFGKLTQKQERILHFRSVKYWALVWIVIAGHAVGFYGLWVLCPAVAYLCVKHTVNAHDCDHLKTPLPFIYRLTGYGLFCAGFLPLAAVYSDVKHQHLTVHHPNTKVAIDHDENDPHSRLARMSLLKMIVVCILQPGHVCMEDILIYQLPRNPSDLWPERVATNLFHWVQLALLYRLGQGTFWPTLAAGHFGMAFLWLFFNGLIHYPPFFRFLVEVDPSGLRRIHPIVDGAFRAVSENAWLEIKWHDLHHAMSVANSTYGTQMARGITYEEIEVACADLVDEGLFLDERTGNPVSHLAEVGHKLGSRRAYQMISMHTRKKRWS